MAATADLVAGLFSAGLTAGFFSAGLAAEVPAAADFFSCFFYPALVAVFSVGFFGPITLPKLSTINWQA